MLNLVDIKYSNNGWVLSGKIEAESTISPDTISIKIFDALEHYSQDFNRTSTYNNDKSNPLINITGTNNDYCTTGDTNLVRNGFIFQVSNNYILFKMSARGVSTLNPNGYYDETIHQHSGKVGFNIAIMSVSVNGEPEQTFNLFLAPKLISSKPFRIYDQDYLADKQLPSSAEIPCTICNGAGYIAEDIVCPACNGSQYLFDRVDFNYDSDNPIYGLYVNNHNKDCSATYKRTWDSTRNTYVFTSETSQDSWRTPKYGILVSAYLPSYIEGLDDNLLSSISSTLTNDLNNNNKLDYDLLTEYPVSATTAYIVSNGAITADYSVYIYQQNIEITDDTQQKIRNNVVRFGVKTND